MDKIALSEFLSLARERGTKWASAAYGIPLRTVQRSVKEGSIPEKWSDTIADGPTRGAGPSGKPYQEKSSTTSAAQAAKQADERPVREIVAEQKLVAGESIAAVVDGVLCVTETALVKSGVEYRPIRKATFPELNQAIENAHATVLRGNQGVPYAVVLGSNGRYFGVILGSNTNPGAVYDDEGYQALLELANTGEIPTGWDDTGDEEIIIEDDED